LGWITGVKRTSDGELLPVEIDKEGNERWVKPANDALELSTFGTKPIRLTLRLDELRQDEPCSYLVANCLGNAESSGQSVYWGDALSRQICIPAQVLIKATLAPLIPLQKILFKPLGTQQLMHLIRSREALILEPNIFANRQLSRTDGVAGRHVTWIQAFPSASRAWASVYRHALTGKLDMHLPKATVDAYVRVDIVDNKLYAKCMTLASVVPEEEPHEFAKGIYTRGTKLTLFQPKVGKRLKGCGYMH